MKSKNKFKFYFLWLSLICIIAFIFQNLPGLPNFTETFILNQKALLNFQIWRFITAIFLHGSITHLIFNLFALMFFGIILEKKIGSNKFLITFLLSGIIANIISINFYTSSLGASGAIYGILGSLTIIAPMVMVWAFGLMMPMFLASILWVAADILRALGAFGPTNIGSYAHLSGIAIGILIGIIIRFNKYKLQEDSNKPIKITFNEKQISNWENQFMK
jgi:uncharacterized protein